MILGLDLPLPRALLLDLPDLISLLSTISSPSSTFLFSPILSRPLDLNLPLTFDLLELLVVFPILSEVAAVVVVVVEVDLVVVVVDFVVVELASASVEVIVSPNCSSFSSSLVVEAS